MTYKTLRDIIKANEESTARLWFDADTMRFFRTVLDDRIHPEGEGAYFVTSELQPGDTERKWSVRYASAEGIIRTVGDFYSYDSAEEAHEAAAEWAAGNDPTR